MGDDEVTTEKMVSMLKVATERMTPVINATDEITDSRNAASGRGCDRGRTWRGPREDYGGDTEVTVATKAG